MKVIYLNLIFFNLYELKIKIENYLFNSTKNTTF